MRPGTLRFRFHSVDGRDSLSRGGKGAVMRPSKTEAGGSGDLFRARLDQIINMRHELVRLADELDWDWIDSELADLYKPGGRPAGLYRSASSLSILSLIHI